MINSFWLFKKIGVIKNEFRNEIRFLYWLIINLVLVVNFCLSKYTYFSKSSKNLHIYLRSYVFFQIELLIPSIGPSDNLLILPLASVILINELRMYSFQVLSIFEKSLKEFNLDWSIFSIISSISFSVSFLDWRELNHDRYL